MKLISICLFLLLLHTANAVHAQQSLIAPEKATTTLAAPNATSIISANAVVAVQVRTSNDTIGGGQIRYKGLFNIGTADGRSLLFQYPQEPITSHFNVRIDGVVYSNDPFRTGATTLPLLIEPVKLPDGTITCTNQVGRITIEQRLTPQQYTPNTGAIFIQYVIENNDAAAHQVGLLLEMDSFIINNDAAPISTSFGYSRREQQFSAPFIPDYFQAFERNDLTLPGVVAQGTLIGRDAVRPDLLIVGDWTNLSRVPWDYVLPNQFYNDSAVILRWNERRLASGERRMAATYYGRGDVSFSDGTLALNLTAPPRLEAVSGQLTPNPFEVNLVVTNAGFVPATSVQATLHLPQGLALVSGEFASKLVTPSDLNPQQSGTASWKVLAQCPVEHDTLTFNVLVTATNPLSNSVSRTIIIPSCAASLPNFTLTASPSSRSVVAGGQTTYTVSMQPSGGFANDVSLSLFPSTPGVASTFTPSSINATTTSTLTLRTDRTLSPGTYNFVMNGTGGGLTRSDTVSLVVQAPPSEDKTPPFALNHRPAKGATNVPLDADIQIEVRDDLSGVDRNALVLEVNGQAVLPNLAPLSQGYVLQFKPALRYNATVLVITRARDLAQPANVMSPDTLRFSTIRDVAPPFTTDHLPARGASNAPANTNISLHVRDLVAGVDRAMLAMNVNGAPVSPMITGAPQDYKIEYDPPSDFAPGDTVRVSVAAQDLAFPPNIMPVESYSFIIQPLQEELSDLAVTRLEPAGTFFVGTQGTVIGEVANTSGMSASESFNVQFRVDGGIQKDTTFSQLTANARVTMSLPLRFQTTGTHEVELEVDAGKKIREVTEANNNRKLVIQISQSTALSNRLTARPNPFTPNNDGFNDQIEFDYSGLGLRNPSLQIFDANGIAVWSNPNGAGGRIIWNGRDDRGRDVTPGVYLYSLREQGNNVASGYVVVAR